MVKMASIDDRHSSSHCGAPVRRFVDLARARRARFLSARDAALRLSARTTRLGPALRRLSAAPARQDGNLSGKLVGPAVANTVMRPKGPECLRGRERPT
jgi:hypothetical protein